ncbi:MBL fold metallo-hydrolase [Bacillus sp. Xin]|uniref:MBL fold metallo-hydrolase n=1 Tax=unclassified Bacillus (in: firmicutes) TaxID=185979 RepID=UPI001573AFE9|nr:MULTISPECIES: MBL fold metallo-hydrolase [unclassified Bacillus (in: firmicutes)]MBC6973970.1 MBL fold metallo-hydrolase [Bacillus sp. Xin]NSW36100.1 MBL fold metallo-hydrolase [Bacillus sp. Xin1]
MKIKSLKLYDTGYCTHPEKIAYSKGSWKQISFPATVGLLQHPILGYILFDTGYARHFIEATRKFPYSVYAKLTPVHFTEEQSIKQQLLLDGIQPEKIKYIILSHFHGDHTAGLPDFPKAKVLTFSKAYEDIKKRSKFGALLKGCLKDTLPIDLEQRMTFIDQTPSLSLSPTYGKFEEGYDVFGDGSLLAVDLTGHAIGQFGLFVHLHSDKIVFLCADAVWLSKTYENLVFPSKIVSLLTGDAKSYRHNIEKLHHLSQISPKIEILPTHCERTWNQIKAGVYYE